MSAKIRTLNILLAGTMLAAPAAFAQEAGAEQEARQDTIVVTGTPIRDSQMAAIEAKRNAPNVADIISADTIGRFPDQNLADSLGRLPGIAIERDQGQARFVNFRGAPFRWTAIAFDGIDVPGAENGRIPRFDSFPSVITSSIEANKAITPDMPGEAVSGFININTFQPFDREGFSFSGEVGSGEQELGGGPVEKYNARISYSNDVLGIVGFWSENSRMQNTDNRELELEIDEATDELIVNNLDFRSYFVERKDKAYGGRVEFRPGKGLDRLFLSTIYNEFVDNEERNQYDIEFADGAAASGVSITPGDTGYVPVAFVGRALEYGKYTNSTQATTLGADFDVAGWGVETRLNYTETESSTFLPLPYYLYGGPVAATYDVSNLEDPTVKLFEAGTMTPLTSINGLSYAAPYAYLYGVYLDSETTKLKMDAEHVFGSTTVKTGIQFDDRDAVGNGGTQFGLFPSGVNPDDYQTDTFWYADFTNSLNATYFDNIGLREEWEEAVGGFSIPESEEDEVSIDESILALYAMGTTEFGRANVVYGARMERTDYTSSGPSLGYAYSDDYVNILPSLHFNYDITDDLKFRASATTGLSRPTWTEMRASASVDPTEQTVSGGNPTLDPETTYGGDLALEWYFAPASLLSATVFYRHVDDVIYSDSTTVDGGIYLDAAEGEEWTLSGYVNGHEGSLTGLELNAIVELGELVEVLDGFGFSGNVTVLDSEFETNAGATFSLPGTSDLVYNTSVYFEKWGLSARVNYQYRDDWLSTTENDSFAEYWGSQKRVDASVRYNLPWSLGGANFTLFANGNNLTDEVDIRYENTPRTPNQVEGYGRHWLVGLRVDY